MCCSGNSLAVSVCGFVEVNWKSSFIHGVHGVIPSLRHELQTQTAAKIYMFKAGTELSRRFNAARFCAVHSEHIVNTKHWELCIIWKLNKSYFHWCTVCYDWTIFVNLESEGANNLNIEKIIFKVVQMKFLAMHITSQN